MSIGYECKKCGKIKKDAWLFLTQTKQLAVVNIKCNCGGEIREILIEDIKE